MLILADENFPLPTVEAMRAVGHDVLWARTKCPGRADAALLERKGDRPIFRMPLRDQPGCRKGFTISSGQRTARPGRSSEYRRVTRHSRQAATIAASQNDHPSSV